MLRSNITKLIAQKEKKDYIFIGLTVFKETNKEKKGDRTYDVER